MISPTDLRAFRRSLIRWYRHHGRDLPWRRTNDPYAILVSEVMLQQTQVATVLPYYNRWLKRFPDFAALAAAMENDVLHTWEGLGYYRRARNLHATAKVVRDRHGGLFPREVAEIRNLPGVGRYTANAVATFAFDEAVPVVEANIARLLSRLFNVREPVDSSAGLAILWNNAAALLPNRGAARFNSALMDLGATICLPRKPRCEACPAKTFCLAENPETLPVKKAPPATKRLIESHSFVVRQNQILLEQSSGRWRKMWTLPPLKLDPLKGSSLRSRVSYTAVFPFTHHQITLRVFRGKLRKADNPRQRWFSIRALQKIPIPSPHRRAITALLH